MNNLTTYYNNDNQNLHLFFKLGENKYAIKVQQVVEILKLPQLDYPQKLENNIVGIMNYNNFTLNVIDLRFYLDIKVKPYDITNEVLIVKTDESMFALIIDKAEDIFDLEYSKLENFSAATKNFIEFIYKNDDENVSVINLKSIEEAIKTKIKIAETDIPSLFPQDEFSKREFSQRKMLLKKKEDFAVATNLFSQNKFISFLLNNSTYCINLEYISEFLKNVSLTKIPCNLDYIEGVISQRGDFITIINLSSFIESSLYEKQEKSNEKNQIIIVDFSSYKLGFSVDEILGIVNIPEEYIKQNHDKDNKFIQSEVLMDEKFYNILDLNELMSDERLFIEQ